MTEINIGGRVLHVSSIALPLGAILQHLAQQSQQEEACPCERCAREQEAEEFSLDDFFAGLGETADTESSQSTPVSADALAAVGASASEFDKPMSAVQAIGAALLTHLNASALSHGEKQVYGHNIVMATKAIHAITQGGN